MRAIWIPKHGTPDVLEVRESVDRTPGQGEIRIRARAAGLNFAEIMARKGLYPDAPKPPLVAGYETAGVIDAVGGGVARALLGRRVAAMVNFGGHSDVVCVKPEQTFSMPDSMSFEEGAALPVNYLTAYHMLFQVFRLRPGDHVLVHMAAGGVGSAVLQLCRTVPDVVTYGTASASKHEYIRALGCDYPIDYRAEDYVSVVRRLTKGRGVDLVLDALGGGSWRKSYDALRPSGRLLACGWSNMSSGEKLNVFKVVSELARVPRFSPVDLMNDNKGVSGINMGHMWDQLDMIRAHGDAITQLYREGKIRPRVDRVFGFTEASSAHRYLENARNQGKVVLVP